MKTFREALDAGFAFGDGYYEFAFVPIPGETYRLVFEPLLWDGQFYVKLCSEDGGVLTEPVVVKPGFERDAERLGEKRDDPDRSGNDHDRARRSGNPVPWSGERVGGEGESPPADGTDRDRRGDGIRGR